MCVWVCVCVFFILNILKARIFLTSRNLAGPGTWLYNVGSQYTCDPDESGVWAEVKRWSGRRDQSGKEKSLHI